MEEVLGSILPKFSTYQKKKLKKGLDFIGINYYTSFYVQDCIYTKCDSGFGISRTEGSYMTSGEKNGVSIGESVSVLQTYYTDITFCLQLHHFNVMLQTPYSWFNIYPQGMEKTVTYVKDRYNNTPMFITENGKQTIAISVFLSLYNFMRDSDKSKHFRVWPTR